MASVVIDPRTMRAGIPSSTHTLRGDIQALRAYAVAAVVLFHVWPGALTGGYIGVDVFFVISGYLITGQLVRLKERGALHLPSFWAARARRLLPAALLVLVVSIGLTLLFAPDTLKTQYLRSIIGSTAYVENWVLAWDAVDYLGADNAPPIAQHYWSLSVEEQFYILWPLVVILGMMWGARRRLMSVIVGLTIVSGVYSVIATFATPSLAYFATPARVWEFGIGAIVALLPALSSGRRIRAVVWVAAWIALIFSALAFDASTPFPGYAALLPVIAAGAVIAVGPDAPLRFAEIQNLRILQWVGDNSYGIYLWHWPLVVIAPAALGHELDLWENIILVAMTVLLAGLSKRFVEDPLRFGSLKSVRPRTILIGVAASMVIVIAASGMPIAALAASASAQTKAAQSRIADPVACQGASVLLVKDCADSRYKRPPIPADELVPSLAGLFDDTDGAFACYNSDSSTAIKPCHIGSTKADSTSIALTGDSHAAMLVPAIRDLAEKNNWSVDVYVGRGCVWSADLDPACETRQAGLNDALLTRGYDAIITTAWNQLGKTEAQRTVRSEQFAKRWAAALDKGIRVIPVIDNPGVPSASAECLSATKSFSFGTCAFSSATTLQQDPLALAASDVGIDAVDLRGAFCDATGTCPMVAGSVVVYRDLHHITASFSHSLAPYLAEQISARLSRPIL